jgi:hypothetical protein
MTGAWGVSSAGGYPHTINWFEWWDMMIERCDCIEWKQEMCGQDFENNDYVVMWDCFNWEPMSVLMFRYCPWCGKHLQEISCQKEG